MQSRFIKISFLTAVLPFLIQCGSVLFNPGENKSENTQPDAGSPTGTGPKWNGALRGLVIPGKEANKYMVQLQWGPKNSSSVLTLLKQEVPNGRLTEIQRLSGDANSWLDSLIEANKTYAYTLKAEGLEEQVTVEIPTDLEYKGEFILKESIAANRIFLSEGAELAIEDRSISVSVNEIISNGATITTFRQGQRAAANTDGRSGGKLNIIANQLTGKLSIIIRGEHGGQGLSGNPGNKGGKGLPGTEWVPVCKLVVNDRDIRTNQPVTGDPLDVCRFYERRGEDPRNLYVCLRPATDGSQGGPGSAGGNGGVGRNGGNSGVANISIKRAAAEDLTVSTFAGEGGSGGTAGRGGEGGEGGDPGFEPHGTICPAKRGPQGPSGAEGQPGLPGQPGKVETYCLATESFKQGSCD